MREHWVQPMLNVRSILPNVAEFGTIGFGTGYPPYKSQPGFPGHPSFPLPNLTT
ncbi:hypothetical protein M427DRAFT_58324 [Gonapodya prolifera JEL478]|uniref:Uncharacterized protein n=1 Tax=Gonapodya prolifera (strain JEL478) TaxID=1344416 RepID=A0A139AAP7_GONPJ|nr:hypothetical protein M427DRAFT_58324 [Gonapodya prolifera JEL478]|eukprot:KXS13729.1 hypothetical protein M427DRAFT_58324 [Gonapodya prolifera JEL478]